MLEAKATWLGFNCLTHSKHPQSPETLIHNPEPCVYFAVVTAGSEKLKL